MATGLARYFQRDTVDIAPLSMAAANTGAQAIGDAIQGAGSDLVAIGKRDEQFQIQKTLSDAEAAADKEWDAAVQEAPEGAPGFEQSFGQRVAPVLENARSGLAADGQPLAGFRGGVTTRGGRQALELGLQTIRNRLNSRARSFETQQKYDYRKRTITNEADNLAQQATRTPGVDPYSPHGSMVPSGTMESQQSGVNKPLTQFYESAPSATGEHTIQGWDSKYYSPRDFADGKRIGDTTGAVHISQGLVARLDWVTEQFGYGKLQINSGYRSPQSNMIRARSGLHGPHTHGNAVDIQVRDLPQAEKNRLYSLLKSQGFNSFGFGAGVLHAEIRDGKGNGRGGDFEWTYGGHKKYDLVPVMGGAGGPGGADWRDINAYPYLPMARLTARSETGSHDLVSGSKSIAYDTNGTRSYGIFGINSGGPMQRFVDENPDLGLTAKPGTLDFDYQWRELAAGKPEKLIRAQLKFHEKTVVRPAQQAIVASGLGKFSNDPRAVAFVSDMVVQYGRGGIDKHLAAAAGATSVAEFIEAASDSMRASLDYDFRSNLAQNPDNRKGLLNRIDARAKASLTLMDGGGTPATGNVPLYRGPVPDINNVPGYQERMDRIDAMIETMGGTAEQRAVVRENMRRMVTKAWLLGLAQTNPSAAMSALHSGKYDDALTIEDDFGVSGAAESGWNAYEAQIRESQKSIVANLKAETAQLVADEAASLAATGKGTGALTDQHRAMMTDADRESLDLAQFSHLIGQQISNARREELPGILEQLKPDGEGFALEQKKYDYAQKLIDERLAKQANDPAGYTVQASATVRDLWTRAMTSNDPQKIQAAITAMRDMQLKQGVPASQVRSLTASAQTHNAGLLKDPETADAAFANFAQMKTLYGGEFQQVLDEMERDGGPKGWADVNRLVDAGLAMPAKSLARVVHAGQYQDDAKIGVMLAMRGQAEVARTIFDGRVKRHEISGADPKPASGASSADEIVQEALGDALVNSPSVLNGVREAAKSYYVNGASLGAEIDEKKYAEAVQKVTGGILEHNGDGETGRFIAPIPGMTQSQFDRLIGTLKDEDLKGAQWGYGDFGESVTAIQVIQDAQLESAGNGKYAIRFPGAGLARDKDGFAFLLDMGSREALTKLLERANRVPKKYFNDDPKIRGTGFDSGGGLGIVAP